MGRLRSDVRAVAAIVAGAAVGVVGTVMTLGALDRASVEAEACVESDVSEVVYTVKGTTASVLVGSRAPRPAVTCERAERARTLTIIRSHERDGARIQVRATPLRLRGEELRLQVEEMRARSEEVRQRSEEVRQRVEEVRARSEEARVRVERLRSDRSGVGGGSGG